MDTVLCAGCYGTGFDPSRAPRQRCRACGGSGLSPAPERLIRLSNNPEHWLNRAEEMRTLADDMHDASAKEMMLRMALDYEKIAARIENNLNPVT